MKKFSVRVTDEAMRIITILSVVLASCWAFTSVIEADESPKPGETIVTVSATDAQVPTPVPTPVPGTITKDSVFIIICDEKPGQVFVIDSAGKWLSTIRDVTISFSIGQKIPSVVCTLWSGPFKPTNPEIKTFELVQLKSVTNNEFQSMIDASETDPEVISHQVVE